MSISYSDIQRQAIMTADEFLGAALEATKRRGLKPDPLILAAFMKAASDDYSTMVGVKLSEEKI